LIPGIATKRARPSASANIEEASEKWTDRARRQIARIDPKAKTFLLTFAEKAGGLSNRAELVRLPREEGGAPHLAGDEDYPFTTVGAANLAGRVSQAFLGCKKACVAAIPDFYKETATDGILRRLVRFESDIMTADAGYVNSIKPVDESDKILNSVHVGVGEFDVGAFEIERINRTHVGRLGDIFVAATAAVLQEGTTYLGLMDVARELAIDLEHEEAAIKKDLLRAGRERASRDLEAIARSG
jgi:hypothetical protein